MSPSLLADEERAALRDWLGERARFDEPLAPYTSWRIGGPADLFAEIASEEELGELLSWAHRRELPWFVLGYGSNLLVGDGGIRGLVMRLGAAFSEIAVTIEEDRVMVRAGAAASMALVTAQAASQGAIGIGSLAGIPGSVGGALRMNAGTDRETGEFVREVWVRSGIKPESHAVTPQYFYRRTTLRRDEVVTRAVLAFERGEPRVVREEMRERLVRRKRTQPLQFPNAGSCFRNPPGDKAGRLIEAVGAKGWRSGGAEVSELHANFIVNRESATAADVATLLTRVREAVAERFGVELELEVHFVGVFM